MKNDNERTESFTYLSPGTKVLHYTIVSKIGAGGMGEVYLAEDAKLNRKVALKFLPANASQDDELRIRFTREAQATAKLNHPHIVTIYEVDELNGRPFYAMEYIEGETIDSKIRTGQLSLEQITEIIRQCADALDEAHKNGVVHRDIKPANIIIDKSKRVRLVDFGLAALVESDKITRPQTTMGTFSYISPEQARGETCDGRTDLFSLGVVWYEMLTGASPFTRESSPATLQAIIDYDPPHPEYNDSVVPEGMWNLIRQLLEKSVDDRMKSACDLVTGLERMDQTEPDSKKSLKSIAILPFANMSDDPSQEYFCDGIAEDIINDLTRLPDLRVVARTSAFAFKGKNEDMRKIGRQLNVQYILEGSVRKAGNQIRVTAQLIKVADGFHLWSERYDREITDIFRIQDDIVHNVVEKLIGILQPSVRKSQQRQIDIQAYESYNRGRFFLSRRDASGFNSAIKCFNDAISLQKDYAQGFVGLADTYFLQYAYELAEPRDTIARARSYILRALEIDPDNAEAYTTLGGILTFHDWAWSEAEEAFKKSLALNPGYSVGHQWYGELLGVCGRLEEAEALFRRARELDPLADITLIMHGVFLFLGNKKAEAISYFQEAIAMGSRNENAFCWLGFAQLDMGMNDEAMINMKKAREFSGNSVFSTVMHCHACYLTGDTEGVQNIAREIEQRSQSEFVSPALQSVVAFDTGEKEKAYHLLNDAIRNHNSEMMIMSVVPYYKEMREDPVIRTLLGVLGLIK